MIPMPGSVKGYKLSESYKNIKKFKIGFKYNNEQILKHLKAFGLPKKGRILDVGCGTGHFIKIAEQYGYECYGNENAPDVEEFFDTEHLKRMYIGDFLNTYIPLDFFDAIVIIQTIEHLLDPLETIKKALTLLKKDSLLYIETPNFSSLGRKIRGMNWQNCFGGHLWYFTENNLKRLIKDAGGYSIKIWTFFKSLSLNSYGPIVHLINTYINFIITPLGIGNTLACIVKRTF